MITSPIQSESMAHRLKSIHWMGISLCVPSDWEIRRHGISPEAGSLVFVDRRIQRMEVIWQRPAKEPDVAQTVNHAMDAVGNEHPDTHVSSHLPSRISGWQGFVYGDSPRVYRALTYHAEWNVLLQVTLSLDGSREETHTGCRDLLASVTVNAAPDKATRWRAFGIDCRVPEAWTLLEAKVNPMDVRLKFDCGNKRRVVKTRSIYEIRRMGMAQDWFDGDLYSFAKSRAAGAHPHVLTESEGQPEIVRVEASQGRFFFLGGLGPKDRQHLRIWKDPEVNSMFVISLSNPGLGGVTLDAARVESCALSPNMTPHVICPSLISDPAKGDPLLDAVPVRNQEVTLEREGAGAVLRAPLRKRWWMKPPFGWFFPFRDSRGFGVDAYGIEVWEACDGDRTIKGICERFAAAHAVSFGEARVAVYQFLQTLTKRELIVIQVAREPQKIS